ncbi:MAG: selenocysteine-specific translation elongation factor [Acidobacteriota bacterium]|nr:selenocysteine-specific translation elongation factor [Acidobacteriota bacterium]
MKSVIVGTAGHIDHGKTALVKALTGIDADRLAEEKRRGITIELGFAHATLPTPQGGLRLGFVDVPGHERFVRNMLAGVGGMDLVLLVVSAEDSIKPQTREHFDICRLLQVPRGIVVITKCDLVDSDTRQLVRMELEEFVRGSFLEGAPIVEVSAFTGEGLEQLKSELARMASEVSQKDAATPFRLPVDRVFTIKGFGTVVTGTLIAGRLRKEDEVEILPTGRRVRVRGLQTHGKDTAEALAGQRTAVNLAGIAPEEIERGQVLAERNLLVPTHRLDVQFTLLSDAPVLKNRARVHLHLFTAELVAAVKLYGVEELLPGQTAWAQLRTAQPIACAPGDRFILRRFSPVTTIGGGVVADVRPLRKLKPAARVEALAKLLSAPDAERLAFLVTRRLRSGLTLEDAAHETGWSAARLKSALNVATRDGAVRAFAEVLIAAAEFTIIQNDLFAAVGKFQKANPLAGGINRQELMERAEAPRPVFLGALDTLVAASKLATTGDQVHLPGKNVVMQDDEAETKRQIEDLFAKAGWKVPTLKEALAGAKVDAARAQKIVTLLLREKVLIKISDDLVFHQRALEELKRLVRDYKSKSPQIDVARFKELTGVTRKHAIPLLEHLDREHVTRRAGDARIIL